jgi:hypothetical protein
MERERLKREDDERQKVLAAELKSFESVIRGLPKQLLQSADRGGKTLAIYATNHFNERRALMRKFAEKHGLKLESHREYVHYEPGGESYGSCEAHDRCTFTLIWL